VSNPAVTPVPHAAESRQRGQYQDSDSVATRHLCAGVYLDRVFRDLVIRQVHNDSRRRVAPSYGFDLVPVVRHAWWSWFLDTGLQLVIVGCLVSGVVLSSWLAVVLVVCAITVCLMIRIAARIIAETVRAQIAAVAERWFERRQFRMRPETPESLLRKRRRLLKVVLAGCVVVAVVPIVVSLVLGVSLGAAVPAATTIGCVLVASAVLVGVLRQLLLNAVYRADSLRPTTLTRREQVIDEQQSHSCVIYPRPEPREDTDPLDLSARDDAPSPFIGSGKLIHRWLPPMTIQLLRPGAEDMQQREYHTPPFAAHELVERLRAALQQLGADPGAENLPGLQVRDRLYVAEADICTDRSLLRNGLDKVDLWQVIDDHRSAAHHFLETSVPVTGGELVTTVLLRVSVKGRCLSLDVATCALTRTPHDYQVIDAFAEHGTSAVLHSAVRSVFTLPADVTQLWRLAEIPVVLTRAWRAIKDRTHIPRRGITVGAQVAVREEKADDWHNAQLDETTLYDHMKIIEQRILKVTADFLKAHDVDISMFEKQATNIINSGVLNMGGRQEVNQSAVGTKARVIVAAGAEGQSV
jgi:cell division protein FtsL